MSLQFTLWDVDHGLCAWILTPKGQTHCIDAGHNNNTDFSPFKQMKEKHDVSVIDFLAISHPDQDHIEGLPSMRAFLGNPRVLCRNKTLPDDMNYGNGDMEYQKIFKELNEGFICEVSEDISPINPEYNGNINILEIDNTYEDGMSCNNTSVVFLYKYNNCVIIFPGDIDPSGWNKLYADNKEKIDAFIKGKGYTILVAPHHGRSSGYSQELIDVILPDLILVSDEYGKGETDNRYYNINGSGVKLNDKIVKLLSTKTHGRIKFIIKDDGKISFSVTK